MSINPILIVSLTVFVLDQASKFAADLFLAAEPSWPVIKGFFHLTLVHNTGAAFGFLKGGTYLFILISIFCIGVIVLSLYRKDLFHNIFALDATDAWIRLSLGLILGGALGNLIDRLRFSYVVDFLDFRVWPVFNVADSAITIGGVILFIKILNSREKTNAARPL